MLPANDLGDVLGRSALRQFELSIWNIQVKGGRAGGDVRPSLSTMIQSLKDLLVSTSTDSRHLVVIDGLDDVLLEDKSQNYAISGLILEASRLNQYFRQTGAPYKILVVCRTDIYERLPGANQNKIRQDMAVEVQWYEEAASPQRANLVNLANLRARYYDPTITDVFSTYFPSNDGGKNTIRFLLEHTRHTPREFLQLLRYIQRASGGADDLDWYHIKAGLRSYCDSFFLPELRDELEGVIERSELDRFFECLRHLHKQQFTLHELIEFFGRNARCRDVDVERVVTALFGASALGNCHKAKNRTLYTFRYRNPVAAFNPDETITTHRALARALNLHN